MGAQGGTLWAFSKNLEATDTNGPEFVYRDLDMGVYTKGVELDFSRPGKPTDNAFMESFTSSSRQERLNQHWFLGLEYPVRP